MEILYFDDRIRLPIMWSFIETFSADMTVRLKCSNALNKADCFLRHGSFWSNGGDTRRSNDLILGIYGGETH